MKKLKLSLGVTAMTKSQMKAINGGYDIYCSVTCDNGSSSVTYGAAHCGQADYGSCYPAMPTGCYCHS